MAVRATFGELRAAIDRLVSDDGLDPSELPADLGPKLTLLRSVFALVDYRGPIPLSTDLARARGRLRDLTVVDRRDGIQHPASPAPAPMPRRPGGDK